MATSTIRDKLIEANQIKKEIRLAVISKDIDFPEDTPFADYPAMVNKISGHLQEKNIQPSAEGGTVYPDDGYDGFSCVILPAELNLVPDNIVEGISVFGVTGTAKAASFDTEALFAGTIADLTSAASSVRDYAFYYYTALKTVAFANLTSMGKYAFNGCSGMTSFSAPKLKSVASYGLNNCTALVSFVDDALTVIDTYAFSGCTALTNINLAGVTEVKSYGLNNCKKVAGIGTLKVPTIGSYGCYYLGNTTSEGFVYAPDAAATIGDYGLEYAKVTELNATLASVGSYGIAYCSAMTRLHAAITGAVATYGLAYDYYVNDIDLSESTITSLGTYAFFCIGASRSNPSTNVITLDLRKCTFKTVDQYAFAGSNSTYGLNYTDIYLPDTVTTINAYAFRYAKYLNLYMESSTPPTLSATTCFGNATNYKVFIPYDHINAYYTATNWSTIKANIVGYAPAGTFAAEEDLPTFNGGGMGLTWYSDAAKTSTVTKAPGADMVLYCDMTSRVRWVVNMTVDENTTLTLTDSEGVVYTTFPAYIPLERTITLDLVAQDGWGNNTTVNGTKVTFPYVVTLTEDLTIKSSSWEGEYDTDFTTASWASIQAAILNDAAKNFYAVGSTRTVELKNGSTITLRVANNSGNLYERADGSTTGFVLEFVDLWPTAYYMNSSSTNAGGWDASYMRKTVMPLIWAQLPDDLQDVIATVKVKACKSGTDGTLVESEDTLFLPAEREIFASRVYSRTEEWNALQRWQYYAQNDTNADRIKRRSGSAAWWWLRSPNSGSNSSFVGVYSSGASDWNIAYTTNGVAPGFCI